MADSRLRATKDTPGRPQDGALFGQGLGLGGGGRAAQFAVAFMMIDVQEELVEQAVGACEFKAVIGGQQRWEAFLPAVLAAFDFAFGLRGRGVAEFDAVEVEGLTELGEGSGIVGLKQGMEVHIQGQGQAVGLEGAREEVQMGQQGFGGIAACADMEACGVVQEVEQDLLFGVDG